jgi:hypothetical protein
VYIIIIYNIIYSIKWPALKPPQKKKKTSRGRERVRVEVMAIIIYNIYIHIIHIIILLFIYQNMTCPKPPRKTRLQGGGLRFR